MRLQYTCIAKFIVRIILCIMIFTPYFIYCDVLKRKSNILILVIDDKNTRHVIRSKCASMVCVYT